MPAQNSTSTPEVYPPAPLPARVLSFASTSADAGAADGTPAGSPRVSSAPAWPSWRHEIAALARLARRRTQFAKAFGPVGDRLELEDEIALVAAHLADLNAVAQLRAARVPATLSTINTGTMVEVSR